MNYDTALNDKDAFILKTRQFIAYIVSCNTMTQRIQVRLRDGSLEPVDFDKIHARLKCVAEGLPAVDIALIEQRAISKFVDKMTTNEIDDIVASFAESLIKHSMQYSVLATRIVVSNLHRNTPKAFSEASCIYSSCEDKKMPQYQFIMENAAALDAMIINDADYAITYQGYLLLKDGYLRRAIPGVEPVAHQSQLPQIADRPQYMFARVAVEMYWNADNALELIQETYNDLSSLLYIHATPTLFNACSAMPQLNSCFLLGQIGDNQKSIMRALEHCAIISKSAGGIGINQDTIRSAGSYIHGTKGLSSGLVSQLKLHNSNICCWNQGGKRPGSEAIYLSPWHADIMSVLALKLNAAGDNKTADDATTKARELFYALWCPDAFVRAVENNEMWNLFSPDTAPGLNNVYDGMRVCKNCDLSYADASKMEQLSVDRCSMCNRVQDKYKLCDCPDDESWRIKARTYTARQNECELANAHEFVETDAFTALYNKYTRAGLARNTVPARKIMELVYKLQAESGGPYVCHSGHVGRRSNQEPMGVVQSSNLCTEIMEVATEDSIACCTLASVNLRAFWNAHTHRFDYAALHAATRRITRNLNRIIDCNMYPLPECARNSYAYRPIGIGIQGLADLCQLARTPYDSAPARVLEMRIVETMYHAALTESVSLAKHRTQPDNPSAYKSFDENFGPHELASKTPATQGILQFDMWQRDIEARNVREGVRAAYHIELESLEFHYDWDALKAEIREHKLANSLLIAHMPTASTSQLLGNSESFELRPGNIFTKARSGGAHVIVNDIMVEHLESLGLWNESLYNEIRDNQGSLAATTLPQDIKQLYYTASEVSQAYVMSRAAMRGAFVDQAASLNLNMQNTSPEYLEKVFLLGYKLGLKTGSYYIRSCNSAQRMKNTAVKPIKKSMIEPSGIVFTPADVASVCKRDDLSCTSCSS